MTASWTLTNIIKKVRNVTATPSEDELSDTEITDYINQYYTFTMPLELKEQVNLQPINFTTLPNVNVYPFPSVGFITDQPMAYADGFPLIFYQDRDVFIQDWPMQYAVNTLFTGDGVTTTFTGAAQNPPIIQGTFLITDGSQVCSDNPDGLTGETIATGNGTPGPYTGNLSLAPIFAGSLVVTDGTESFTDNGFGVLTGSASGTGTINYTTGAFSVTFGANVSVGNTIDATYRLPVGIGVLTGDGLGTINYVTGAFSVTFNSAPSSSATIYAKYQGYQPARPQGVLFYNNEFTFMPVPDQVYQISMQGFVNQLQLTDPAATPLFQEWGPLLAYGASVEIFADRGDTGAVESIYPFLKRYENVALGRYVEQMQSQQGIPRF